MSTTLKQLSYEDWLKENPDIEMQEQDCLECGGSGQTSCYHCGNDMDCEEGEGSVKIKTARKIYEAQKERDSKLLSRYSEIIVVVA